jgi:hypothetical protein
MAVPGLERGPCDVVGLDGRGKALGLPQGGGRLVIAAQLRLRVGHHSVAGRFVGIRLHCPLPELQRLGELVAGQAYTVQYPFNGERGRSLKTFTLAMNGGRTIVVDLK